MSILTQIIDNKRKEISAKKSKFPVEEIRLKAESATPPLDFKDALRQVPMGLIAEVKRQSPSAGIIRDPFDPAVIATDYALHGAQAISCLMDEVYFGGGEADFSAARAAVTLPMLYKEFVVDPWQIYHAKLFGASAVLLIVGALSDKELKKFHCLVRSVGLQALVEVHDEAEMRRAVDAGSDLIGINNRNLKTFVTSLDTTYLLSKKAPDNCLLVSESGIKKPTDVVRLKEAGAQAILVGESLLREGSPGRAAKSLMSLMG